MLSNTHLSIKNPNELNKKCWLVQLLSNNLTITINKFLFNKLYVKLNRHYLTRIFWWHCCIFFIIIFHGFTLFNKVCRLTDNIRTSWIWLILQKWIRHISEYFPSSNIASKNKYFNCGKIIITGSFTPVRLYLSSSLCIYSNLILILTSPSHLNSHKVFFYSGRRYFLDV